MSVSRFSVTWRALAVFTLALTLQQPRALAQTAPSTETESAPAPTETTTPPPAAAPTEATAPPPAAAPTEATAPPPAAAPAPAPRRTAWTAADVARVRAMLASARAQHAEATPSSPSAMHAPRSEAPTVHGDAGAALALGFSVDALFYDDVGYDLVADDDVTPRFGLWASYDLLALADDLFLAGELGWGMESTERTSLFGGELSSDLVMHTVHAAVSARYVLLPWLQPHARLAFGASAVSFELTGDPAGKDSDDAVAPLLSLGAGVLLRTPTRLFENQKGQFASLGTGILIEGGYALRGDVELALEGDGAAHAIATRQAKLGALSLSGPYVRTSLVVRF